LFVVTVDREIVTAKRLSDERRDNALIIGTHSRAIRIEDAHSASIDSVFPLIRDSQRLPEPFGFIVRLYPDDSIAGTV
jgi:hypothetical protein